MVHVSIVVPVYNVESYLIQCLDSLVNQTLKDIEIIVVNDCSPANEDAIIRAYAKKDKRIRYIKLEKNVGVGQARNIGFSYAKGEYFGCVDSDDYTDVTMFEKMYEKAKRLDADICIARYWMVNCKKNRTYEAQMPLGKFSSQYVDKTFRYMDIDDEFLYLPYSAWSRIYKKEFHQKYIQYTQGVKYEDVIPCFTGIFSAKRCCVLQEPLYFYRTNRSGSIMGTPSVPDICRFLKSTHQLFKKTSDYARMRRWIFSFYENIYISYAPLKELYNEVKKMILSETLSASDVQWLKKFNPFILKMIQYDFDSYMHRRRQIHFLLKFCPIKKIRKKIKRIYK